MCLRYCQINFRKEGQSVECNQKGVGKNNLVWVDWFGRIVKVECGFAGSENDRDMYNGSRFYRYWRSFLRIAETVGGNAIFHGPKGQGSRAFNSWNDDCYAPFNSPELVGNPHRRQFNRLSHRYRVVVENAIGLIKKWLIVSVPYRGDKEDQAFLWIVASRLTAFTMRIRNKYPRGEKFMNQYLEQWEEELGEYLWFDAACPGLF